MTKREFIKFIAKLGVTVGVLFVLYQNHFTTSLSGSFSLGALIGIGYIFIKKYKDIKKFCLEESLRLRVKDNVRIKTPRRELFAWAFYWVHVLIPAGAFYWFTSYIKANQQDMDQTAFLILIIIGCGAILAFVSLFVSNDN